tara:strand:+ start:38472 stop:39863 length:1392 start_codon:yes stop_codon:yes gene_type:complete
MNILGFNIDNQKNQKTVLSNSIDTTNEESPKGFNEFFGEIKQPEKTEGVLEEVTNDSEIDDESINLDGVDLVVSDGQENYNFGTIKISDADLIENGKTIGSQLTITEPIDEIENDLANSENETTNIGKQLLEHIETAEQLEVSGETSFKTENENNLQNQSSNLTDNIASVDKTADILKVAIDTQESNSKIEVNVDSNPDILNKQTITKGSQSENLQASFLNGKIDSGKKQFNQILADDIQQAIDEKSSLRKDLIEEDDNVIGFTSQVNSKELSIDQIISSPLFSNKVNSITEKSSTYKRDSRNSLDEVFVNSSLKDINNNAQNNELSKVQRTSFSEHINKILDQKELISKIWSKSYVEFENGQRVDVFARKFENEFQFRIETNLSELQQKIEDEVDKIKNSLLNKFETDINFFFGKDNGSSPQSESKPKNLHVINNSAQNADQDVSEESTQKNLGYNSNEWVA